MAKKIIGGIGGLLGIGGKKKKAETPAAEQKGPIVTPLAPGTTAPNMRRRRTGTPPDPQRGTILGGNYRLGG